MKRAAGTGVLKRWLPLAGGMICGFGILWFFGKEVLQDEMFFGNSLLGEIQYLDYKKTAYLIYLIKIRGIQLAFIMFMAYIRKKRTGLGIWAFMTGSGFGTGLYAMLLRWGPIGILGYLMMIFPHYLCYFYAYSMYIKIDSNSQKMTRTIHRETNYLVSKMSIIGVVIIGIWAECYVNPLFIKLFSKIFL